MKLYCGRESLAVPDRFCIGFLQVTALEGREGACTSYTSGEFDESTLSAIHFSQPAIIFCDQAHIHLDLYIG